MRAITASIGPFATASATNIRTASGVSSSGPVTLNGTTVSAGVATLDVARRVLITVTADEHTKTLTFTGTGPTGNVATETITLPSGAGTAETVLDYKTITSVTASAALTGNLSLGTANTGGVAATAPVMFDSWAMVPIAVQVVATSTINFDVQVSNDDPNAPGATVTPATMTWSACPDGGLVGKTSTVVGQVQFPFVWARVLVNSYGDATGKIVATFVQPSAPP